MSYNVYTAEYSGMPNHEAIFIETNPGVPRLTEAKVHNKDIKNRFGKH
jgi:hypothetical protein